MAQKEKIRAPSKISWRLRYKEPKCERGTLKNPIGKRICKRKTGPK